MKHLIISAVNLVEAGTLEILRQCLHAAVQRKGWRVTAIVNSADLVGVPGIEYIERPDIKPSWRKRIFFEYVECKKLAQTMQPDFWFSLHDTTPNLGSLTGKVPQAVYCHNAMCFYRMPIREMWLEPKLILFSKLYSKLYNINLQNNDAVIVQQDWMRDSFRNEFGYKGKIIVAHPALKPYKDGACQQEGHRFFYPSFPRAFKNFELLLEAWQLLCKDPAWDGELTVTIKETLNPYCRSLEKRFGKLPRVNYLGKISRDEVDRVYSRSDCLVFPSKLESWGMPIVEAKQAGLFILAADLPYAHEAIGDYDGAAFFPHDNAEALAASMKRFRQGALLGAEARHPTPQAPYAANWKELFQELLD